MPHSVISEQTTKPPESLAKQSISGHKGVNQNYDKSLIHLARHSSFTMMQGFAKWGNTGQNKADGKGNTTDLTNKGARLDALFERGAEFVFFNETVMKDVDKKMDEEEPYYEDFG